MYLGQIVEPAPTKALYATPLMPYTEALMSAVPQPDPKAVKKRIVLEGELPSAANPPGGCYVHTRCPYAQDVCKVKAPDLREIRPEHFARCHFAGELNLQGVDLAAAIQRRRPIQRVQ
jgi:peptide/nickel transport system ATP-binding protein